MSIFDMFRTAPAQPSQSGQQQNPQQQGQAAQAMGTTQPNQGGYEAPNPSNQNPPQGTSSQQEVSGIDKFRDLWENKPTEGAPQEFNPETMFNMDPEKMKQAVSGMDFSRGISQEQMAAVAQGGEGAVKAMMEMMNEMNRQSVLHSTQIAAKLVQQGIGQGMGHLDGKITKSIRQNQISQTMRENNPALNNPAIAPMLQAMETQFAQKHPQASPQEIAQMAREYVTEMANVMNGPQRQAQEQARNSKEMDWDAFMQS